MTSQEHPAVQLLREAADIIAWMSGSNDFGPGGIAHEGWMKAKPRFNEIMNYLKPPRQPR